VSAASQDVRLRSKTYIVPKHVLHEMNDMHRHDLVENPLLHISGGGVVPMLHEP
jgi:hypothetical protein